jgi:hypothetical protein
MKAVKYCVAIKKALPRLNQLINYILKNWLFSRTLYAEVA